MADRDLWAVVMAGGSGTRFWPASRAARPKQYLSISGGAPLLAETVRRVEPLVPRERILVVTAERQRALVRECLPELPDENVLGEPEPRNTAPCVAWAACEVARRAPDSVQVVLPADHVIRPAERFRRTLAAAAEEAAASDALLTLGIRPTSPETGYGYIEAGEELGRRGDIPVQAVRRFVEKPDRARAEAFLARGGFYWNAGIFAWSTRAILRAVERCAPELHAGLAAWRSGELDLAAAYASLPAQPIDVAVMERADNVRVLPVDYSWNDVGSWAALPDVVAPDERGNVVVTDGSARVVALDAAGCVAYSEGDRVLALVGVEDLVVVQTADAVLVCPRDRAQDVKRVVDELKRSAPRFV